mmetsp:Transcript_42776/g.101533  ORF Transcript_42776/g.101533 Transcript_42776/m.101533 type:complete len:312 (+) Transcript_42776:338-1273(+)
MSGVETLSDALLHPFSFFLSTGFLVLTTSEDQWTALPFYSAFVSWVLTLYLHVIVPATLSDWQACLKELRRLGSRARRGISISATFQIQNSSALAADFQAYRKTVRWKTIDFFLLFFTTALSIKMFFMPDVCNRTFVYCACVPMVSITSARAFWRQRGRWADSALRLALLGVVWTLHISSSLINWPDRCRAPLSTWNNNLAIATRSFLHSFSLLCLNNIDLVFAPGVCLLHTIAQSLRLAILVVAHWPDLVDGQSGWQASNQPWMAVTGLALLPAAASAHLWLWLMVRVEYQNLREFLTGVVGASGLQRVN